MEITSSFEQAVTVFKTHTQMILNILYARTVLSGMGMHRFLEYFATDHLIDFFWKIYRILSYSSESHHSFKVCIYFPKPISNPVLFYISNNIHLKKLANVYLTFVLPVFNQTIACIERKIRNLYTYIWNVFLIIRC